MRILNKNRVCLILGEKIIYKELEIEFFAMGHADMINDEFENFKIVKISHLNGSKRKIIFSEVTIELHTGKTVQNIIFENYRIELIIPTPNYNDLYDRICFNIFPNNNNNNNNDNVNPGKLCLSLGDTIKYNKDLKIFFKSKSTKRPPNSNDIPLFTTIVVTSLNDGKKRQIRFVGGSFPHSNHFEETFKNYKIRLVSSDNKKEKNICLYIFKIE